MKPSTIALLAIGLGVCVIGGGVIYAESTSSKNKKKKADADAAAAAAAAAAANAGSAPDSSTPAFTWYFVKCNNNTLAVAKDASGNVKCYSTDGGKTCHWGITQAEFDALTLTDTSPTLDCGADQLAKYGITGYDTPTNWCNTPNWSIIETK